MQQPESILKQYWGYDHFRPLQKEIIESILQGNDTMAILPTGGGKSICFQVPAMAKEGICIVISPLIALMKDQVENLKKRSIPALLIHSGMKRRDVIQTLKNATGNYFRFIYLSPERLETSLFKEYLPALNVNLIAVDEAHCISQWGYDFRPSYLRIAELRKELPGTPMLALTASATASVQKDICDKLGFSKPNIFRQSFERKNLSYSVFEVESKIPRLVEIINKVPGTGIVYCKSRKRTTDIANVLKLHSISADHYHAGLSAEERSSKQLDWISNKTRFMVCTNAFGMGIDKPEVRTVIHVDSPDCLENYYQEAGRAGRDGKRAYTVLLFDKKDIKDLELLHTNRYPSFEQIRKVYDALVNFLQIPVYSGEDKSFNFNFEKFVKNFKLQSTETLYALKAIEQDGWFEINEKSFTQSTILFTSNRMEIEQFQKTNPEHEKFISTVLRTHEGILDFPAFISETFLSKLMHISEEDLKKQIKAIASFGILQYLPQAMEPQLTFRKNRVLAEELSFDHHQYNKRREVFIGRVKNMIGYVQTAACRSVFINKYFGDDEAKPCGICDNCLNNKNKNLSQQEFREVSAMVLQLVAGSQQTIDTLVTKLDKINKQKLWTVINYLQSEKKIRLNAKGWLEVI
ncbi:MAG: RecQ family ATP-dependent DNA helicase [Flavisolibacter sp.]|jgi:ATP-dependent DNA helicase RecQ|nr:RecQ family ATP-dependent DNA helicase [Flavisolibacter sp.]